MKNHHLFLSLFMVVLLLSVTGALSAQEKDWDIVAAWSNQSYETMSGYSAKVVYDSNGTVSVYKLLSDTRVLAVGTYIIDDSWTEPGIHWFKIRGFLGATTYYEIDKLTNMGTTYESVFSTTAYPAKFDPNNAAYGYTIRYRQAK
jgi:hypothetical protein